MKTIREMTLIIVLCLVAACAAHGQSTSPSERPGPASAQILAPEEMIRIAEDFIYQNIPWKDEEVTVKVAQGVSRVTLPAGKVEVIPTMETKRPLGLVAVRLDIRVDDQLFRTMRPFFHVRVIAPVVVARETIPRGEKIDVGKLDMVRKDLSLLPANVVTVPGDVEGKVSKWTLGPGTIITMSMIDDLPLVRRGENVSLTIGGKGVTVTIQARAMADGKKGDTIKVMNLNTRKEISAKVVDTGRVEAVNP
jgi:flagella basal body P-ring formation protein FlgA